MTSEEIAYCAGFVDADGCFVLERSRDPRLHHGIRHSPKVSAYNNDRRPLELLQRLFGGSITARRARRETWRDGWDWAVSGQKAVECARVLMPHLRRKGVQAYILSCFDHERTWTKGGVDRAMPDSEFERREILCAEMKGSNHA